MTRTHCAICGDRLDSPDRRYCDPCTAVARRLDAQTYGIRPAIMPRDHTLGDRVREDATR